MITPIDLHAAHAVGFAIDGSVSDADLARVYEQIDAAAGADGKTRLYIELRGFPTFDGVKTFVQAVRRKTGAFEKIEKYALVTDRPWIGKLTTVADYVTARMDVRTFDVAEADVAQAWLLNDEPTPEPPSAIEPVEFFDDPNVVAVAVNGKLRKRDYDVLDREMNAKPAATSLYLEIRKINGLSLNAIMDELEADAKTIARYEKVAVVGWQSWLPAATRVADWLTPKLDVRYFDVNDAAGARLWLGVRKNTGTDVAPA